MGLTLQNSAPSSTRFSHGMRRLVKTFPLDALVWCVAMALAALLRYEDVSSRVPWRAVGRAIIYVVVVQFLLGWALQFYQGRHLRGSFESMRTLVTVFGLTGASLWIVTLVWPNWLGLARAVPLIATALAILFAAGVRWLDRYQRERRSRPAPTGAPVLLYGAGQVGEHLARQLTSDTNSTLQPVAVLDDDPGKRLLQLHGVPVKGNLDNLPEVVADTGAKLLVVAMGMPSTELLNKVHAAAAPLNVKVKVMPTVDGILTAETPGLRDLEIEDLLGRAPVDTDVSQIAGYLNGKTVLVTGAGGSIGSQLCVEIDKHGPGELILLDRDETGLQETEIGLRANGLLNSDEVVLADIRDRDTLVKIFKERQPDVVFHAAALKHLPMLEQYPDEAWQTNVLGTLNVIEACREANVGTLINISTDKAANPTSVLGLSKRTAERLVAWQGNDLQRRYLSVRFGNVIGSRGSMLPTFQRLIEEGNPVTVTHPDATRYFMTIPEACQLVLQAGAIGRIGEVLILDMGEPVRILDVANKMIAMSGKD